MAEAGSAAQVLSVSRPRAKLAYQNAGSLLGLIAGQPDLCHYVYYAYAPTY